MEQRKVSLTFISYINILIVAYEFAYIVHVHRIVKLAISSAHMTRNQLTYLQANNS